MHTRRRYHHGDLRSALLTRAEETLREKGPAALSLRELARDLGVSHAAPSRHFKDKQALLDALALTGFDRLDEAFATRLEEAGDSFPERLAAAARAYVDFGTANSELLDLMYSIKHTPEASEDLLAASQRWTDRTVGLIAEGQRRGEVREGPLERVGVGVFSTLHGYATLAASGSLPSEVREQGLDELVAYMLRGCAPAKAD
ncbi:TetR/AcrR family transcriptional regulator [Streptomyces yaanensis]|uniref:TetR/AcrR family transcriptional regulator n=1 Tax=Streptomyces yaanensis TaxID=1142239 RepID=A0ABV7SPP2_9ACTN|nr:TetR/AcrR family transcriptional regulator [Streptomyces sp. CGMCC 4.7035]WNC02213.1 TetR/AcrR family transcriptional regulator [Streptomyces sp. CGMCC 4.7035]